jgi:hypothetical protein
LILRGPVCPVPCFDDCTINASEKCQPPNPYGLGDKDKRMMARIKVANELKTKVDIRRCNLDIIKPW